ncbi:MAG: DUF1707 domain-containing protein [Propionibacteriaceae bacterium]|jgi:hypothetical protein|nr:DUF1707 domain-containing protein [Propionibacteriaceae bacterium]
MSTEPRDVGPLFGGDRPIRDSDRQLVINLLHSAHADGRLSDYDFHARMQYVYHARTFDDLVPVARDLMN